MKKSVLVALATSALFFFNSCSKDDNPSKTPQVPSKEEPDKKDNSDPNNPTPDQPDTPITGGDEIITINIPHYILSFAQPSSFDAVEIDDLFLKIGYYRINLVNYCDYEHEQKAQEYPDEAAAYTALCERYDDMTYDQERSIDRMWGAAACSYLINNIVSIDVVSAANYDSDHPAGTSLKDICRLISMSPRDYIASGYTDTYDWSVWPEYFPEKKEFDGFYSPADKPFCKLLSECTPEDMVLMGEGTSNIFMLGFTKKPDAGSPLQQFTITITNESGKTYITESNVCEWK